MLTAHPTEVRRKSTLTRELEIARLIDARHLLSRATTSHWRNNEEQLRRVILILWRTNMLRLTRLRVIDEVANGLSYYDYTFFTSCRASTARSRTSWRARRPPTPTSASPRSCASARGSAATATATPTSPPTC